MDHEITTLAVSKRNTVNCLLSKAVIDTSIFTEFEFKLELAKGRKRE